MTEPTAQLARIVESHADIATSYRHSPKLVVPSAAIEPAGATLKWYSLHPEWQPVPEEVTRLARSRLLSAPIDAHGLGFVVLHRCEQDFYFLIVCTWRNSNELWESVYYKDGAAMQRFEIFPRDAPHKPGFCVWELVVVWHEQQSWRRFLDSARDVRAAQAWLHDVYAGPA
jgi:hypothetical protein